MYQKTRTLFIQSLAHFPRTEGTIHTRFAMLTVYTSGHFIVRGKICFREAISFFVPEVCEDHVEKIERLHAGKTNVCICGL